MTPSQTCPCDQMSPLHSFHKKLPGEPAVTATSLPNVSLSCSLQINLQPNLTPAVLCSDYSFLQRAGSPNTWCSGRDAQEVWGEDFTSFKWQICANKTSLKVACRADASHICGLPAFNKDFTLGTRALSSRGGDRDVKSICQMSVP